MVSDAVIFVPGIKGTKLVETNRAPFDTIWSGVQSNFESIEDLELTFSQGGTYFDERIKSVIKAGEIEELAYGEFLSDLNTTKPVFIFNYDWRMSSTENGERLAVSVDYLAQKSTVSAGVATFKKFDFITHSLGNFVVRNYIHQQGMGFVNKIVFTVPPFKGSLDIVVTALIGEGFFPNVKSKIRKLVRTFPGALELLPTYQGVSRFSPSAAHNFFNFNHWQGNVTGPENPNAAKMKQALKESRTTVNSNLLDLSALTSAERKRVLVVARTGYDTFQTVRIKKSDPNAPDNFVDFENALRNSEGDGRVAHASSCCYFGSVKTLMLEDAFWYRDYSHGFVLKDERVQKIVNRFLFGSGTFSHAIPGGSIKRVVGLDQATDADTGLKY